MIIDQLRHADRYRSLSPGIAAALEYLTTTKFDGVEPGRYELGDGVFAIVDAYQTRTAEQEVWESHRKYIDVQYIVRGAERMGWMPLSSQPAVTKPYDAERDVAFYAPGVDRVIVREKFFTVFYPEDVHAPGLAIGEPSRVMKVVVKVPVA
jgi:YhcH/YjgK/YiaL family protein